MKYMLAFNSPAEYLERDLADPKWSSYRESWRSYLDAIYAAGIVEAGQVLKPPYTWSSVRIEGGKRHVQDGPFPDVKELLGGYLIIDVPSLDDALVWAERSPSSEHGSTDVKPVMHVELD